MIFPHTTHNLVDRIYRRLAQRIYWRTGYSPEVDCATDAVLYLLVLLEPLI
jgi:hypothetical protein